MNKLSLLAITGIFIASNALGFGVDVCFNAPNSAKETIQNCITVDDSCRTSNLTPKKLAKCKIKALLSSIKGLFGNSTIIGGRSLVHSDSTYLMAQLIGFTPWQAYEMSIYDESVDQSEYVAFDQTGKQILSNAEINACRTNWGANMPNQCLLITPMVNGISKFNFKTGGMLLHWRALYTNNDKPITPKKYPTSYLNKSEDAVLTNFKSWVMGERANACAAGITTNMSSISSECAADTNVLNSPQNLFFVGVPKLSIHFATHLGELIISQDDTKNIYANDESLQAYLAPDDVDYAKLGILLHIIGDRHSHHLCIDNSYFFPENEGNYTSKYSAVQCAQGSHFLRHVWEQGTPQSNENISPKYQTMRPALSDVYDQLIEYANHQGIAVRHSINKQELLDNLINVLQITDSKARLDSMVQLMENYNVLPLPGHGSNENTSIDTWLTLASAPVN